MAVRDGYGGRRDVGWPGVRGRLLSRIGVGFPPQEGPARRSGRRRAALSRAQRPPAPRRRLALALALTLAVPLLSGCTAIQSVLRVGSVKEGRIADLWWGLFGISVVVWAIITFLMLWAVARRRGPDVQPRKGGVMAVVIGGIILPAVILSGTFAASLLVLDLNRSPGTRPVLTMEVIGHDWWWEARYPHFTTANEIHIPVGQSVEIKLRTADVIHSFWVPSLSPKVDLIPSKQNSIWLHADKAGVYRGQCAEFCGAEHAGMAFIVVAQPRAAFNRWMAAMAHPAATPTTPLEARGRHVFMSTSCASCHAIAGTPANGQLGPPLTHFGSRRILGAGVAPNNFGNLTGWIANSQTLKPGNLMPPQPLPAADLIAVATYLEGLK